jgi:hypothetical protein
MLRGIEEGGPAGYGQDDLARDLGIEPGDPALPRAASAYAGAFTPASGQKPGGPPASAPVSTRHPPRSSRPSSPPEVARGLDGP